MVAFATQVKRRRGTQEQNDAFTGAEGEIVVDLTNMTLRVHDGRTRGGFVVGGGAGRNIGDIFFTARTDTSLNGAVEANGGQYNTTDFVGAESIGNILSEGKVPYMTIADFDTAVANNGFCSSFGWDGGTVFKVPKIPGMIITKDQLSVVGNGMTLGLTDGTNNYGLGFENQSHKLYMGPGNYGLDAGSTPQLTADVNATVGVTTDPEKSGIIATVDTVELRPMVQLANGATDEAVVVAGNVLADIAGIKDGDGFTQPGKNAIVGWGMPDYSAGVSVANNTVISGFTAPEKGILMLGGGAYYPKINGIDLANGSYHMPGDVRFGQSVPIQLDKGDTFSCQNYFVTNTCTNVFYPFKGVN